MRQSAAGTQRSSLHHGRRFVARSFKQAWRWARTVVLAGLLIGLCAPAASAIPTDINPDSSSNAGDPNASSGGRVNHMAATPGDNQTSYLASEYGGVFKSSNGGSSWAHLNGHIPTVAWDVEVDPASASRVIASSWYDGRVAPLSGIEVSTNAGSTWTHPATSWPNPTLEGTANDNTPAGFSCSATARNEPSAFGISIQGATFAVGTNCGVALSTNSGVTWSFVDPTPATSASNVWDVLVQGSRIDACGNDGHVFSTNGGTSWSTGGSIPTGRCSIAASPDESDVLFIYAADNNVYESDNAGGAWFNLGNPQPQGRIPFVVTNQRADTPGPTNKFDLWAGDTQLFSADCTTPTDLTNTTTRRCPTSASWTNRQNGAHFDGGDLLFDSQDADGIDACPVLYSSDGGVHTNTIGASPGCQNPTWTRSNVNYHGLWLWTMAGANRATLAGEDLLFGNQDNGTFVTSNAGANPPTWLNPNCCDTFDVLATPTVTLGTVCCYSTGRFNRLERAGAAYAGNAEIPNYPGGGTISGFTWGHRLAGYGTEDNNVALLMSDTLYLTDDIQASPIVWSALPAPPNASAACNVETSLQGATPVFFVQTGQCTGRGDDRLYRYEGTGGGGAWDRLDDNGTLSSGIGIFAVDPNDDDRLYVSDTAGATIRMMFSTDGGTTWTQDTELDTLMTGNGTFKYENASGPSTNKGGAGAQFQGYPQPVLLSYSQVNGNTLVAGGVDSGVFLSLDGGANWSLVTDPFTPGTSGVAHLPRPRYAYFDDEPAGSTTVYIGTQGRGVWRLMFTAPTASAGGPYNTVEGADVQLDASASTGTGLTYAWDFDNDGQYDDATGVNPTFDLVGRDGVFPVSVKVTDSDGAYATASTTVTVANVAPVVGTITTSSPKPENTAVTVSGVVSDAGWLDPLTATIDWGDGAGTVALTGTEEHMRPNGTITYSVDHVYGDDGAFTVTVCVSDDDVGPICDSAVVTITNVNPTATINTSGATDVNGTPVIFGRINTPVAFSGRSTDPGSDDLTLRWNWDDGPPTIDVSTLYLNNPAINPDPDPSPQINPRDVTDNKSHGFGQACTYTVGFSALDDDGGSASASVLVLIRGPVGTHDKSAGYWVHEYRYASGDEIDPVTLGCYLKMVGLLSRVFDEVRDASTFAKAYDILRNGTSSARDRFDRVALTCWLNFANGAFDWNEPRDTNGDGQPDTTFRLAMQAAETVRLNPAATTAQIDAQRKILQTLDS